MSVGLFLCESHCQFGWNLDGRSGESYTGKNTGVTKYRSKHERFRRTVHYDFEDFVTKNQMNHTTTREQKQTFTTIGCKLRSHPSCVIYHHDHHHITAAFCSVVPHDNPGTPSADTGISCRGVTRSNMAMCCAVCHIKTKKGMVRTMRRMFQTV